MNKVKHVITRKLERGLLLLVLSLIPILFVSYFIYENNAFMSSIPVLLSLSALLQLEIAGLFDELEKYLSKTYTDSGLTPSHITRKLYEFYDPEPTKLAIIKNHLYTKKRVGFYLAFSAGLFQLVLTWCM